MMMVGASFERCQVSETAGGGILDVRVEWRRRSSDVVHMPLTGAPFSDRRTHGTWGGVRKVSVSFQRWVGEGELVRPGSLLYWGAPECFAPLLNWSAIS